MKEKIDLTILGGGLKGATLAGVLAQFLEFRVRLVEMHRLGGGASSTNHGRAHRGYWNFPKNSGAMVARNRASFQILKALPDVISSQFPANYCFESSERAWQFLEFCDFHELPSR